VEVEAVSAAVVATTTLKEAVVADTAVELAAAVADINATKVMAAVAEAIGAPEEEVVVVKATAVVEDTAAEEARAATVVAEDREATKVSNSRVAEVNGKKLPTV